MKDGLQNVPIDRLLMRIKDLCSICASVLNIVLSLCTILGGLYYFTRSIDNVFAQLAILQQQQSATQQLVVNKK